MELTKIWGIVKLIGFKQYIHIIVCIYAYVCSAKYRNFPCSWSGIGDGHLCGDGLINSISNSTRQRIQHCETLIIDEISMISADVIEKVETNKTTKVLQTLICSCIFINYNIASYIFWSLILHNAR